MSAKPMLPTDPAAGANAIDLAPDMSAGQLLRRSRRLLWLTLLPLLATVLLLAGWQAYLQWRLAIDTAAAEVATQRFAFEVVTRDASNHITDMRHWVQQDLFRGDEPALPVLAAALKPRKSTNGQPDGYSLDELSPLLTIGMAQLMWPQGKGVAPKAAVLRQAQNLSSAFDLAHKRNPDFVWSYFFGWPDKHVVLFPWAPTRSFIEDLGVADMSSGVAAWYGYEVVTAGLPENNPLGKAYWTAPYVDAGGKGLLVSHALPLFSAGELHGIVGTDIRLETLEKLLSNLPGAPWRAWVVDDRGHLLADRQQSVAAPLGSSASAPSAATAGSAGAAAEAASAAASSAASAPATQAVVMASQRLPGGIDQARLALATKDEAGPLSVQGQRLIAARIGGAPWTLVLAAPEAALWWSTLPQVLPYSVIALGLLAVWLIGQGLLSQRVLTPVLQLLGYLQRLSTDASASEPRLAARWQPWVQMVTRTFAAMRASAQRELRADTLKSAIVDHAQAALVVSDDSGHIVEFNPAAVAMLGYPRDAALGRTVRELLIPERDRTAFDAVLARMLKGDLRDQGELKGQRVQRVCCHADGRELPVEVLMWITQVEGATYFTASMTDLTAARAAAEVIERQRDALRQSEKLTAMGSLLAGVAHELNNPLAIVMGRAILLEEKTDGSDLHAEAVRIRVAAERCGRIVRTFLNMARSRPAQHGPVRINDLARVAADMMGYTLRSHGIELELRLGDNLPEVQADGDQIGQVVLNLIVNAQQALAAHTGLRRITLRSGFDPKASLGGATGAVWLRITDSGDGVAENLRDKIFEPFFTTKAEDIGTGLGLSVSRGIVRDHGGELALEAAVAQPLTAGFASSGASFLLTLPLKPAPAAAAPGAAPLQVTATKARVLVVDDEPEIADLLRTILQNDGYEVTTAASGAEALEELAGANFGAIVSDLRMPDMDGVGLWRAVRARHPALAHRVLFVTGDTLSPDARQFLDETGCLRLEKPFAPADVLGLLARVLTRQGRDAAKPAASAKSPAAGK